MTSSARETELCQYHYDALDRLISHALADTPERRRFYCKSRLATEIQGAMRYSIIQQGDQLLAQQRSEGDAPDTTLLATDQQRSVLQTVKANHPPQPITYPPYGHRSAESGLLSLLGFNGERPDPVTGHYLLGNGYRAFNPSLMRFNSPDSWSPFGKGGLNSYSYCQGDPINFKDPNGHAKFPICQQVFDSISNAFSSLFSQYRSPSAITYQTVTNKNTTTIFHELNIPFENGSTRTTHSWRIGADGQRRNIRSEWVTPKKTLTEIPGQGLNFRKTNPKLQELSLNKISDEENDFIRRHYDIQLDTTASKYSILNRASEIAARKNGYYENEMEPAFIEALNGSIRGVDPRVAKKIANKWRNDPRQFFDEQET